MRRPFVGDLTKALAMAKWLGHSNARRTRHGRKRRVAVTHISCRNGSDPLAHRTAEPHTP
jgi:hypothetical protein